MGCTLACGPVSAEPSGSVCRPSLSPLFEDAVVLASEPLWVWLSLVASSLLPSPGRGALFPEPMPYTPSEGLPPALGVSAHFVLMPRLVGHGSCLSLCPCGPYEFLEGGHGLLQF